MERVDNFYRAHGHNQNISDAAKLRFVLSFGLTDYISADEMKIEHGGHRNGSGRKQNKNSWRKMLFQSTILGREKGHKMETPKRRYEVHIHIGADDRKSLLAALRGILFNLDAYKQDDEEINLISGGWDSSYSVIAKVDSSITGDSYRDVLLAQRDRWRS